MTTAIPRVGFDCETHLIAPGRLVPRLVCLSIASREVQPEALGLDARGPDLPDRRFRHEDPDGDESGTWTGLLTGAKAIEAFRILLERAIAGDVELVAHNSPFDLAVLAEASAVHPASRGPFLDLVFEALDRGAILDTMVREQLINIALAHERHPRRGYYSLAALVERYLGFDRSAEKGGYQECEDCVGSGVDDGLWCDICDGLGSVGPFRLRYHQLDGVPLDQWPPKARSYATDDALDAVDVANAQDSPDFTGETSAGPVLTPAPGRPPNARSRIADEVPQIKAAFAMHLLACRGVMVDPVAVSELAVDVEALVAEGLEVGQRAGFVRDERGIAHLAPDKPDRPGSVCTAALHNLLDEAYGGLAERNDPTDAEINLAGVEGREPVGSIKAERAILLASGNADLAAYAETGEARKIYSTYLPILRKALAASPAAAAAGKPCGPITSSPNVLVATGRVSWRRPNWTNPPRKGRFRECIVPRPGFVLVACDYSAIEFLALGQICLWLDLGDDIARAIIAGLDPHLDFAANMLQIPYAEAERRLAAGDEEMADLRQVAKVANYGFPGGMGAERFVDHAAKQGVELKPGPHDRPAQIDEAWRLKRLFLSQWPCVRAYFDWVGRQAEEGRFTLKQWISGRLRGEVGYTDGCNGQFQSVVADGAKAATVVVVRACYKQPPSQGTISNLAREAIEALRAGRVPDVSPLAGCRPVLFLHDEIIIEVPCVGADGTVDHDYLTAAADELARLMVAAMAPYIPDLPVEAEPAAMWRWYKGAKTKRDDAGRLQVWVPKPAEGEGAAAEAAK